MTKKQWSNLTPGTKVYRDSWTYDPETKNPMDIRYHGKVVRFNFGCHQVLIDWGGNTGDIWHGRTQIEIDV